MSIDKPDADAIKHNYIGEIEVHTSKLSQDIHKEQAVVVLLWLADIIGDEPALKARVVECCFTTIKKIEASEVRNGLMRVVRVHLGESAAPGQ